MDVEPLDFERRLLAARAKRLAERPADDRRSAGELATALTFRVRDERLALDVAQVAGVTPLAKLTPVPGAAPGFLGVMAVKGEVLSVFDLATLLSLGAGGETTGGYVLILKRADARVGVLVQQVDEIAVTTPTGRAAGGRPLVRVGPHEMILVTNLEKALAPHIHGDGQ